LLGDAGGLGGETTGSGGWEVNTLAFASHITPSISNYAFHVAPPHLSPVQLTLTWQLSPLIELPEEFRMLVQMAKQKPVDAAFWPRSVGTFAQTRISGWLAEQHVLQTL